MKATKFLIAGTLSASLLLAGCSDKEEKKPDDSKQPVEQTEKSSNNNKDKETATSPSTTNKDNQSNSNESKEVTKDAKDKELVSYVSKQQDAILDFLKVINLPSVDYTKESVVSADAHASESKISISYQFKNPKTGALDLSVRVENKDDLAFMYKESKDYTKKTVDGVDYYVSEKDSLKVFFVNKEGHAYSLYSDSLKSDKLIELAKTFKTSDELSNILAFDKSDIHQVDYLHENELSRTSVFSNYSVYDGNSFTVQNNKVSVSQSTNDETYQFALEGLKVYPEDYSEIEITQDLKGIYRANANMIYLQKGDKSFVLTSHYPDVPKEALVEMAKEL